MLERLIVGTAPMTGSPMALVAVGGVGSWRLGTRIRRRSVAG